MLSRLFVESGVHAQAESRRAPVAAGLVCLLAEMGPVLRLVP